MNQGNATVSIGFVQKLRKVALLIGIAIGLAVGTVAQSSAPVGSLAHETVEYFGLVLIALSVLGRSWCSAFIGGHKNRELVTIGPYSLTRNPLYVFSAIGAAGVGAQFGSVTLAVLAAAMTCIVFAVVIRHEEELQAALHGDAYARYRASVPRFLPRFANWQQPDILTVSARAVRTTFLDSLFFLLALPLAEDIEYFQTTGALPVLLYLP